MFFTTLSRHGFVTAINRCIELELATVPVLILCTLMLPRRAREEAVDEVQRSVADGVDDVERAYSMAR
jgi:hypothetical protein